MRLLAVEYGISVSALYRFQQRMSSSECAKLIPANEIFMEYSPKTMCLLCCDLVFYLWLSKDKNYQQTDILRECQLHADSTNCADCIYYENSAARRQWKKENVQFTLPICRLHRDHMLAPMNRFAIRRLLQRMLKQQRCFCREGVRTWQKKYGHFLNRKKPDMVNSLWMGDHHQCQCFVRITERHSTHENPQEREIPVRPYLTVWLDVASGYIVGWVISVMPNSSTIAEAFCRAAVYTVGDVAHGLPVRVMTDCGKDYRSKMLTRSVEGDLPEADYQSRLFSGNGLFPALNIKVMKNAPYHPMSKSPVEVLFGILERRFFSKLPGWCRESAQKRPYDFQKRLDRQWKNGELFSLEEFVDFFRNKVLPEYHHGINLQEDTRETVMREYSNIDLSQWHTPLTSLSPYEKYISLPKERDLTPTWRSMALFQMYRKDGCSVSNQGIRFRHIDCWHSALADVIGSERNTVSILYNTGSAQSDVPLSLTAIYQGKFLCEAYPADVFPYYDASTEKLAAFHDENRAHRNKLRQNYERIAKAVRLTGLTCSDETPREMWGHPLMKDFATIITSFDEHRMAGILKKEVADYLKSLAESEQAAFTREAENLLAAIAKKEVIGGVGAMLTMVGRAIPTTRALYYHTQNGKLPTTTECYAAALAANQQLFAEHDGYILPPTPEPVTIDEALVRFLLAKYKIACKEGGILA